MHVIGNWPMTIILEGRETASPPKTIPSHKSVSQSFLVFQFLHESGQHPARLKKNLQLRQIVSSGSDLVLPKSISVFGR